MAGLLQEAALRPDRLAQGQVQIKGMGVKVDGGAATVDVKGSMINLN